MEAPESKSLIGCNRSGNSTPWSSFVGVSRNNKRAIPCEGSIECKERRPILWVHVHNLALKIAEMVSSEETIDMFISLSAIMIFSYIVSCEKAECSL
ncbi:hypothetical protein RHSIM_Rhsim08G0067500 [Rhododendron simsii]|uniref:Uncharacterized protein n=1 Tax=Rhododendron simsii TaxID=118357 RepID=A0A834GHH5_RHOSS|nr:hypothetical protein RHSIM_Rhsim08G0067500 [Rhododendron simsii]